MQIYDGEDVYEFIIKPPLCYILALVSMGCDSYHITLTRRYFLSSYYHQNYKRCDLLRAHNDQQVSQLGFMSAGTLWKSLLNGFSFYCTAPFRGKYSNHDACSELPVRTSSLQARLRYTVLTFPHVSCGIIKLSVVYHVRLSKVSNMSEWNIPPVTSTTTSIDCGIWVNYALHLLPYGHMIDPLVSIGSLSSAQSYGIAALLQLPLV